MKRSRIIAMALMGVVAAASIGLAQDKSLKETLDELLPGMGAEKIPDRRGPQLQWETICFQAGAPGNETSRDEACQVMVAALASDMAPPARVWLLKQLERIGRGECIEALAAALGDKEVHVRDAARRALTNNPTPGANATLVDAMQKADGKFKAALINALGYRADQASVAAVANELTSRDQAVAAAAARALGKIANAEATRALSGARLQTKGDVRLRVADSYLLCADKLLAEGKKVEATAIYASLNNPDEAKSIRLAAMQGLLNAAGK